MDFIFSACIFDEQFAVDKSKYTPRYEIDGEC